MITPEYCKVMASYNHWMNRKIYSVCSELSEKEIEKNRGAFFGSIYLTLEHLYFADSSVLELFSGVRCDLKRFNQRQFVSYDELAIARTKKDEDILKWSVSLVADDLEGNIDYGCPVRLMPEAMIFDESEHLFRTGIFAKKHIVMHYFNHQAHHRGQVTTMLSQLGYDVGQTDLWGLPGAARKI